MGSANNHSYYVSECRGLLFLQVVKSTDWYLTMLLYSLDMYCDHNDMDFAKTEQFCANERKC